MTEVPDILLWVQEVGFSEQRGAHVVFGHDFRDDYGWLGGEFPSELIVFRNRERLALRGINIANVHRFGKGREWETTTPEGLPKPPFLLTDDLQCRLMFEGQISFTPTSWAADEIAAQFEEYGISPVPLFGCGWFGVLEVGPNDCKKGHLLAFSREPLKLADGYDMRWAGEDEDFGHVEVSFDNGVLA